MGSDIARIGGSGLPDVPAPRGIKGHKEQAAAELQQWRENQQQLQRDQKRKREEIFIGQREKLGAAVIADMVHQNDTVIDGDSLIESLVRPIQQRAAQGIADQVS